MSLVDNGIKFTTYLKTPVSNSLKSETGGYWSKIPAKKEDDSEKVELDT